nr:MAG TPA: hypothetical protein [Caudoviricetes sp.]
MSHHLCYNGIIGRLRKAVSRFTMRVTPSRHRKG